MAKIVLLLRSGGFLTRERAALLALGLTLGYVVSLLFLGLTAHGVKDYAGRPLGTDFSNVYAAGLAALQGDATAPFDVVRHLAMERRLFGPDTLFYGWHYPPFFLFVAMALAKLSYLRALILWQGGGLLLWLGAMALLLRKSAAPQLAQDRLWLPLALGFSAVFVNLIHGQNGLLTTALFAAGLALLDERPILAGLLLGLLCYKPQFAVVIPLVLAATSRWRSLGAAAATVLFLAIAVTAMFGWSVWQAFADSMHFTRTVVLEQGNTGFHKMQSLFACVRLLGGSVMLAYAAQILLALVLTIALLRLWRGSAAAEDKKAALCLAALLMTPYCMDYDLMLLAPVIALGVARGTARGFSNYEILSLLLLWLAPGLSRILAQHMLIPFGVAAMLFAFVLIVRRDGRQKNLVNKVSTQGQGPVRLAQAHKFEESSTFNLKPKLNRLL